MSPLRVFILSFICRLTMTQKNQVIQIWIQFSFSWSHQHSSGMPRSRCIHTWGDVYVCLWLDTHFLPASFPKKFYVVHGNFFYLCLCAHVKWMGKNSMDSGRRWRVGVEGGGGFQAQSTRNYGRMKNQIHLKRSASLIRLAMGGGNLY